jgi:hypothetical protein
MGGSSLLTIGLTQIGTYVVFPTATCSACPFAELLDLMRQSFLLLHLRIPNVESSLRCRGREVRAA